MKGYGNPSEGGGEDGEGCSPPTHPGSNPLSPGPQAPRLWTSAPRCTTPPATVSCSCSRSCSPAGVRKSWTSWQATWPARGAPLLIHLLYLLEKVECTPSTLRQPGRSRIPGEPVQRQARGWRLGALRWRDHRGLATAVGRLCRRPSGRGAEPAAPQGLGDPHRAHQLQAPERRLLRWPLARTRLTRRWPTGSATCASWSRATRATERSPATCWSSAPKWTGTEPVATLPYKTEPRPAAWRACSCCWGARPAWDGLRRTPLLAPAWRTTLA